VPFLVLLAYVNSFAGLAVIAFGVGMFVMGGIRWCSST